MSLCLFTAFSSVRFNISCLMYLVHVELNFLQSDRYGFAFHIQLPSLTSTTVWRYCLFSTVYFWLLFQKSDVNSCLYLCMYLQFCFIDNYLCFYTNTMIPLLLQHCNTPWNMDVFQQFFVLFRVLVWMWLGPISS